MKYRDLGTTGMSVSEIGFGTWGIGGLTFGQTSYGKTDDTVSLDALRTALDVGITFFDTANVYGNGHSEELLGTAFAGNRDKVIIASKCGVAQFGSPQDFSDKAIRSSVEGSLRRLRSDYIDLLQLHDPSPDIASDERIIGTLEELKKEGLIRAIGVSVKSPLHGLHFLRPPWQTIQCNFNMIDQRAMECGLIAEAGKAGIGIIARTPLAFGFLSGQFMGKDTRFDSTDHRSRWSPEQIKVWAEAPKHFTSLNKEVSRSLSQLALKFCVSFDSIATTIPGIMTPQEAQDNASVSDLEPLSTAEINDIIRIANTHKFFLG